MKKFWMLKGMLWISAHITSFSIHRSTIIA